MKEEKNVKKEQKHNSKRIKGITLIALVTTIVVLLILAAVSITAVFGDNGILKLAKEAAEKTNEAVKGDLQGIQNLTTDIDDIISPPVDVSKLTEIVTENTKAIDKNGNKLIIPAGFKVLADTEENNVEYADSANPTVEDGIVIADSTGNEFVWVPVFDKTPIYTTYNGKNVGQLYDFGTSENPKNPASKITYNADSSSEPDTVKTNISGTFKGDDNEENLNIVLEGEDKTEEKFKAQLQKEFDYLVASINKYKGFYIGRYETGNLQSNKENIPLVQKENTNIGNVNWYYQYQTIKNISLKNKDERVQKSVTSSMIWGSQWDAVMNWFLKGTDEEKGYVTDSTEMGWHSDNSKGKIQATGTDLIENLKVKNRAKNIYDMGGNAWEWTIEALNSYLRTMRGGVYFKTGISHPTGNRGGNYPGASDYSVGSRATLIVNLPVE